MIYIQSNSVMGEVEVEIQFKLRLLTRKRALGHCLDRKKTFLTTATFIRKSTTAIYGHFISYHFLWDVWDIYQNEVNFLKNIHSFIYLAPSGPGCGTWFSSCGVRA